jgi:hypothetical protein
MSVSPAVKYTLARLGLLVAVFILLVPVPGLSVLLKLMIAVLVSAVLGWFLLRRMRDDVATQVEQAVERRKDQKEKLRSALAGDDEGERGGVQ